MPHSIQTGAAAVTDGAASEPPEPEQDSRSELETLQARLEESLAGYSEMTPRASASIRPLVARWQAAHERHLPQVAAAVESLGGASGGNPLRELMQETVIKLRDAVAGLDRDALDALLMGERQLREAYSAALMATGTGAIHDMLAQQVAELDALRVETEGAAPD
jgi:hypothetical protein